MKNKVYFYFILFYFFAVAITTGGVWAEENKSLYPSKFRIVLKIISKK